MKSLAELTARLTDPVEAHSVIPSEHRRAAVAIVLRGPGDPEVLLMKRAKRDDDRWSGQISLPGGHSEDGDDDLVATAVRETHEEVGVALDRGTQLLGALAPVQAKARGRPVAMTIAPIVFELEGNASLSLGPEADDAFWLPLARARSGELDEEYRYDDERITVKLPAWRWQQHVVWGLTYGILGSLLESAGPLIRPRA